MKQSPPGPRPSNRGSASDGAGRARARRRATSPGNPNPIDRALLTPPVHGWVPTPGTTAPSPISRATSPDTAHDADWTPASDAGKSIDDWATTPDASSSTGRATAPSHADWPNDNPSHADWPDDIPAHPDDWTNDNPSRSNWADENLARADWANDNPTRADDDLASRAAPLHEAAHAAGRPDYDRTGAITVRRIGAAATNGAGRPAHQPRPFIRRAPGLQFQPMVHVDDMGASIAFYEHLGAEIVHGGPDSDRVLLQLGTTQIGLVAYPPSPGQGECTVELNFAAAMPLAELETKLRRDGVTIVGAIGHTEFGAQLRIRTPDGMIIKINQLEPDPYA